MPEHDEERVLVQLAELRQQMASMGGSLSEIKDSLREVVALDRTIAELSVRNQQQAAEITTQWAKIDSNHQAIDAVNQKADEWINKGRGAWSTLLIIGTLAQTAILGTVAYTFTHLRSAEDAVLLLKHRVEQMEQKGDRK